MKHKGLERTPASRCARLGTLSALGGERFFEADGERHVVDADGVATRCQMSPAEYFGAAGAAPAVRPAFLVCDEDFRLVVR